MTFNPDIRISVSVPICDVSEYCFFGLNIGYDFSWDYSYGSFTSYERENYTFSHRFSLMPDFTFVKSNFRFFLGSGFSFGIEPYKYESVYYSNEYTSYKLFWIFNAGLKYKIGTHLFAVVDTTFFVSVFDKYTDDDYTSKTSGSSVMEILPRIGLMYNF